MIHKQKVIQSALELQIKRAKKPFLIQFKKLGAEG